MRGQTIRQGPLHPFVDAAIGISPRHRIRRDRPARIGDRQIQKATMLLIQIDIEKVPHDQIAGRPVAGFFDIVAASEPVMVVDQFDV
jgi:hypothetical protein